MTAKGDMVYAWTTSSDIHGECGGAVTALLQHALASGMVDAVLSVCRGADLYDAKLELITDPAKMPKSAGSLHSRRSQRYENRSSCKRLRCNGVL